MILHPVLNKKTTIDCDYLGDTIYNLLDDTFIIPNNFNYNVFTVTQEYIARPDLVSLDAYGDTIFADVICKINGISNPFELNVGDKLVLPGPEFILEFTKEPTEKEENENFNIQPVAKSANSKRKPNEAIIGDTRFRVDPVTGVIIY